MEIEKENIINELNKIIFHDLPVKKLQILFDPKLEINFTFFQFNEEIQDYHEVEIQFKEVEELVVDKLMLNVDSDIEIYQFDYRYENGFVCKLVLLLGFSAASHEINLKCEKIKLKTILNNKAG